MSPSLRDFFDYLVFRQTDSLKFMNYRLFLEILDEGYLIEESPYEDSQDFSPYSSRESSMKQSSNMESPNYN